MTPLLRLRRFVWQDAVARYWRGTVLVGAPGVYLWREWPPSALRQAIWDLQPATAALVGGTIVLAYAVLTTGPTRLLVASRRLIYWRQFPISRRDWAAFHGLNVALLHAPFTVLVAYALAPLGRLPAVCVALAGLAAFVLPVALHLREPIGDPWLLRWRPPRLLRLRPLALPRLLWLTIWRRRPATAAVILGMASAVVLLGIAATTNLAKVDTPAAFRSARGFMAAAACVGTLLPANAWRLLARDRWLLDGLGVDARSVSIASLVLGACTLAIPALGLSQLTTSLSAVQLLIVGLSTLTATIAATRLCVVLAAVRQRPSSSDERVLALAGLAFIAIVGLATAAPLWLALTTTVAWLGTGSFVRRADVWRRRFALEPSGDNHE